MKPDCLNLFDLHSHNEYKDLIFYSKVQSVICKLNKNNIVLNIHVNLCVLVNLELIH